MFVEGDIFKIEGQEYRLRLITPSLYCWLEPVLKRDKDFYLLLNRIYRKDELSGLEYLGNTYR
jgi:hypothetical protein